MIASLSVSLTCKRNLSSLAARLLLSNTPASHGPLLHIVHLLRLTS